LTSPYRVDATAGGVISAADVKTKVEALGTTTYANADEIGLEAPFNWDNPNYLPKASSPALTGADFAGMDIFFTQVAFRGAFGATNWTTGWCNFDPQNTAY